MKRKAPRDAKNFAVKWQHRVLIYIGLLVFAALSMMNVTYDMLPIPFGVIIYVPAACSLAFAFCHLVPDLKLFRQKIQVIVEPVLSKNRFAELLVKDYRYRTVTFAKTGLLLNMMFAVFNGVIGVKGQSAWYVILSVYYILLSVMRYWAVNYERRVSKMEQTGKLRLLELNVYRNCSILFVAMTMVLGGMVILTLRSHGGKQYPGITIYAFALYAFIKIPLAVAGRIRVIRMKSPLLMTIRSVGYADACVAVLSLQTAMLSSFGYGDLEEGVVELMNAGTGAAMCMMVLGMGVYGITLAQKQKKEILSGGKI